MKQSRKGYSTREWIELGIKIINLKNVCAHFEQDSTKYQTASESSIYFMNKIRGHKTQTAACVRLVTCIALKYCF